MMTLHDSAKMLALENCRFHSIGCPYLDDYHFFQVSKDCLSLASRRESIVYSDFELERLQPCWPFILPTLDSYPPFTLPKLYMGWRQSRGIRYQASSRFLRACVTLKTGRGLGDEAKLSHQYLLSAPSQILVFTDQAIDAKTLSVKGLGEGCRNWLFLNS